MFTNDILSASPNLLGQVAGSEAKIMLKFVVSVSLTSFGSEDDDNSLCVCLASVVLVLAVISPEPAVEHKFCVGR